MPDAAAVLDSRIGDGQGNLLTPLYAAISTAGSGDTAVVAAVTGKKIRVINFGLVCTAANAVTFKGGSTAITGAMSFAANGGISPPHVPSGMFETAAAAALNINLGAAAQVSGWVVYVLV